MVFKEGKQFILCVLAVPAIFAHVAVDNIALPMSFEEKEELKEEAKDMFYHAYRAYMENAYPADELMPLSCKGRWKDPLNSRGDLDDALGNFSLTLVDSLDTLAMLGDLEEFESAVKLVIKDISFNQDVNVSVFETNIRVLGGLLSAHILSEYFQQRDGIMPWYRAELLMMAKDLGFRLLPAFNTTTGIPHSKVNLRHGLKNMRLPAHQETCTACAGTMILEMAALSRLTGEPVFEQKAHRAMDGLWRIRNRSSDLMGTILNVQSGDWVRRDSGVGAGIDSYYEYCLKAYILLGDERYLGRFNKHYTAIMKYISQGPMLLDVHMHRPHTNSKNFMDALLAFWPGLQVLKGDIKPAVETHEMLYQIMQRHNLIPEAFTTDFHVHWGQHPLRPEFVESTYFLYKATNDPYYLEVGKSVLKSLQKFARVSCGYATVKDVRTGGHDDRMDSYVLAETFKYLYLLFADPNDLLIDLDEFLFTTEAHFLPLSLSRKHNLSSFVINEPLTEDLEGLNSEYARVCPNTLHLFPETFRKPLKNLVNGISLKYAKRKLLPSQFVAGNPEHLELLKNMGITVLTMADGRVQLVHTFGSARTQADAKEGILFMQEMFDMSNSQKFIIDQPAMSVRFERNGQTFSVPAGPAHFGKDLTGGLKITAKVEVADPIHACDALLNSDRLKSRIVIIKRGDCMFVNKVRKVEEAGAVAAIVIDNKPGTSSMTSSMFAMSGDGKNDVSIPAVFLFHDDASELLKAIEENLAIEVTIADNNHTGPGKQILDIGPVLSGMTSNKLVADIEIKSDYHAAIERLLTGKEIIRVANRDPGLDKPNPNQYVQSELQQLLNNHQKGGEDIPGRLLKGNENLKLEEGKVHTSWLVQYLTDDLSSHEHKRDVQPSPSCKNNDINESHSGTLTANESPSYNDINEFHSGTITANEPPSYNDIKESDSGKVAAKKSPSYNDINESHSGTLTANESPSYNDINEFHSGTITANEPPSYNDIKESDSGKVAANEPPSYKNNDINESHSVKVAAKKLMQPIGLSLNLENSDVYSEVLQPLKVQILENKLDETLTKLRTVLEDRPKGWQKSYKAHFSAVRTTLKKLIEFLNKVEKKISRKPENDKKAKATARFALGVKKKLESFQEGLKSWDILAKIMIEMRNPESKKDDIILVQSKET